MGGGESRELYFRRKGRKKDLRIGDYSLDRKNLKITHIRNTVPTEQGRKKKKRERRKTGGSKGNSYITSLTKWKEKGGN